MKKHIANIITGSRIVLSLPLLFVPLSSAWIRYGREHCKSVADYIAFEEKSIGKRNVSNAFLLFR